MPGKFRISKYLAIWWGVALIIFLGGIYFQTRQDVIQSMYATRLERTIPLTEGYLSILYPNQLSPQLERDSGRPFILSIEGLPPNPDENVYMVQLQTDGKVLVKDIDGKPVGETNYLSVHPLDTISVIDLYVESTPYLQYKADSGDLILTVFKKDEAKWVPVSPALKFSFPMESRAHFFWRYFLTYFAAQGSMALSLLIAAGGWYTDYLKRNREWQDNLHQFEELNASDPLQAIRFMYRTLSSPETKGQIPFAVLDRFKDHWRHIVHHPQTVLVEINRLFYVGEYSRAVQALSDFSRFLQLNLFISEAENSDHASKHSGHSPEDKGLSSDELRDCLDVLSSYFQSDGADQDVEKVLEQAFALWQSFDLFVREIVVQCFVLARKDRKNDTRLHDAFCVNGNPNRRRLLNDIRLRDIAPEVWITTRKWPPGKVPNFAEVTPAVKTWLESQEFKNILFSKTFPDQDPLLYEIECHPVGWEDHYIAADSAVFVTDEPRDQQTALRMLTYIWKEKIAKNIFAVELTLPFSELWNVDKAEEYLFVLARKVSKEWIRLLAYYPQDFLDMPRAEQIELAEFLEWGAGSREALFAQLQQVRVEMLVNNAAETVLPEQTPETDDEEPEAAENPGNGNQTCISPSTEGDEMDVDSVLIAHRILNDALSQVRIFDHPAKLPLTFSRLTDWLMLRPPQCTRIGLMICASAVMPRDQSFQQLKTILGLAEQLNAMDIFFKVFLAVDAGQKVAFESELKETPLKDAIISIGWEEDSLKEYVTARLDVAAKNKGARKTFAKLIGSSEFDLEEQFAIRAEGSLSRLIEICYRRLETHISQEG